MMNRLSLTIFLCLLVVFGCIEPYTLTGIRTDPDFLVVDGFINASANIAQVRLSKAIGLEAGKRIPPVSNAQVSIESSDGNEFWLTEELENSFPIDSGFYVAENFVIDFQKQYRLKIQIPGGRRYQSEFIEIQKAADVESMDWRIDQDDLKILVTTAANEGTSKYYRWRYEEVYEYNAPLPSLYYAFDNDGVQRSMTDLIYTCYRSIPSTQIIVGSSQNLTSNVLRNFPVQTVNRSSIKLSVLYSIKVEQLALSEQAYSYWLNLFKTTESMGGLFDPLPGQVIGNITSETDPGELVIGFFSGSTVSENRLFIRRNDLPREFANFRNSFCKVDSVMKEDMAGIPNNTPLYNAVLAEGFPVIIGYTISDRRCLDCRLSGGGTTEKPDFWP